MLEKLFPRLNETKNWKIFLDEIDPQNPKCIWNELHLLTYSSLFSDSSEYPIIIASSLIKTSFLTSRIESDNLMNVRKDRIIFVI